MRYLLFIAVLLPLLARASAALAGYEITQDTPATPLAGIAQFYEDTEGTVTLEQAIQVYNRDLFRPLSTGDISQGITPSAFWIRLVIENNSSKPVPWVLYNRFGFTQMADVYIFDPLEEEKPFVEYLVAYNLTENTPYSERPIRFRGFAIPGILTAHEQQVVYIRQGVNYANTQHLDWSIAPRLEFYDYLARNRSVHFFFYGIMAAFILVSLANALRSRSLLMGLYSAYLLGSALSWAELSGHLSAVLLPESPYISTAISNFSMYITGGLIFELGRRFLRLKQAMPLMDRVFQFATILCVLGVISAYLGYLALSTVLLYSLVFFLGIFPFVGGLVWQRGFGFVRWFVVGLSIHAVSLVFLGMAGAGLLTNAHYYYGLAQAVLVVEAAVFGLALAERIVDTRRRAREEERAWREAQRHADTDALTNLPNRRAFEHRLANHLRSIEGGRNTHLAILDIDHFTEINARHGHTAGDACLCELAHLLQESIRSHDFVARYKGSRFALLLTETSLDSALVVLERIREEFQNHPTLLEDGSTVAHTFSAGVATTNINSTTALLIDEANRALALAKQGGKNRVHSLEAAA